jgi:hypothetical protein
MPETTVYVDEDRLTPDIIPLATPPLLERFLIFNIALT